jgi:hypothetical protein
MKNTAKAVLMSLVVGLVAVAAGAADVEVSGLIASSTNWTSANVYNLNGQVMVQPGATLTIEEGTLVRNIPAQQGSLAVCAGGKIFVRGTVTNPVIMTSTNDDMVTWRPVCNEWGNLTVMGKAVIGCAYSSGTSWPTGSNTRVMEGLSAGGIVTTAMITYGGNDDNDDSGDIHYLSLRYGGKVASLNNELNGLSLGGLGRETDIHHVEIMNNIDDGIEIWGGTVNLKYVSIWNIGDDSVDCDQGYRGKMQFGFIVQGYSRLEAQGSGVGDNAFEIDGAEDSDAQPVTACTFYNFTVVGDRVFGDQGLALRDNANVQIRNSIFMHLGEMLVKNDNVDGDGAHGYGYNGTLSFTSHWVTRYNDFTSAAFATTNYAPSTTSLSFNGPAKLYQAQSAGSTGTGYLLEMSDCVFYDNPFATAYTTGTQNHVFDASMNNVLTTNCPISSFTRSTTALSYISVTSGSTVNFNLEPVTNINPTPTNDALVSVGMAPMDGFFTPVQYRGAFSPSHNWAAGWTAASRYGMMTGTYVADPTSTIKLTISTSFTADAGVLYTIESSTDGRTWSPEKVIMGAGGTYNYTDLNDFSSAKLYRAIRQ